MIDKLVPDLFSFDLTGLASESVLEEVRLIRNAGRTNMTDNTEEISTEAQASWWEKMRKLPAADFRLFSFFLPTVPNIVGYSVLSRRNESLYISLAVHPSWRGRGFGSHIYRKTVAETSEPVYAVILKTNIASITAAKNAGFTPVEGGDDGRLLLLKRSSL